MVDVVKLLHANIELMKQQINFYEELICNISKDSEYSKMSIFEYLRMKNASTRLLYRIHWLVDGTYPTVIEFVSKISEKDCSRIRGFGSTTLKELKLLLSEGGFKLAKQ